MARVVNSTIGNAEIELRHGAFSSDEFVAIPLRSKVVIGKITQMRTVDSQDSDMNLRADVQFITNSTSPVPEGSTVRKAKEDEIAEAIDMPDSGVLLGNLRQSSNPVILDAENSKSKHFGIYGRTDTGKSYTSTIIIDEMMSYDVNIVVIDPHGEYSDRLKILSESNPVTEYCENPDVSNVEDTVKISKLSRHPDMILEDEISVLNLVGMRPEDMSSTLNNFLSSIYEKRKNGEIPETKVFMDEADNFAGKKSEKQLDCIDVIASEGRKFGFTLSMITQRPASLDTDVRSQMQFIFLHKLTDETDVEKAVKSAEGIDKNWEEIIQNLKQGECILAGDLVKVPVVADVKSLEKSSSDEDGSESDDTTQYLKEKNKELRSRIEELEKEVKELENTDEILEIDSLRERISELEYTNELKDAKINMMEWYLRTNYHQKSDEEKIKPAEEYFSTLLNGISNEGIKALNWFKYNKEGRIEDGTASVNKSERQQIADELISRDLLIESDGQLKYNYLNLIDEEVPFEDSDSIEKIEKKTMGIS